MNTDVMVLEPEVVVTVTGQVVTKSVVTTVVMISDVEMVVGGGGGGGAGLDPGVVVGGGGGGGGGGRLFGGEDFGGGLCGGRLPGGGGGGGGVDTGQTVVETAMIEVVMIVDMLRAGQLGTLAAQEVMVKVAVLKTVDVVNSTALEVVEEA